MKNCSAPYALLKFGNSRFLHLAIISLACFALSSCTPTLKVNSFYYQMDSLKNGDSKVEAIIEPYREQLQEKMNVPLGKSTVDMLKQKPESLLGNFTADAIFEEGKKRSSGKVDFAVTNYGGLRIPMLPAGIITKGNIFELMPFDNMLVVVEMTKADIETFLKHVSARGGWPVSKGVEVGISLADTTMKYIKLNGNALEENKTYRVLVSDYMANGGDDCSFLTALKREELHLLFRDALLDYVSNQMEADKTIHPTLENRMYYVK